MTMERGLGGEALGYIELLEETYSNLLPVSLNVSLFYCLYEHLGQQKRTIKRTVVKLIACGFKIDLVLLLI